MTTSTISSGRYSVYPGEFVPLPSTGKLMKKIKSSSTDHNRLPVNMSEFDTYFKAEIMMPGIMREEMMVFVKGNILSVVTLQKSSVAEKKKTELHEFDAPNQRTIILPETADTDFITAEYKNGLLVLHIPKTPEKTFPVFHQVIVY